MGDVGLDADGVVYKVGHAINHLPLEQQYKIYKTALRKTVDKYIEKANSVMSVGKIAFYTTSNDKSNFRFELFPQYKANRIGTEKPAMYWQLREEFDLNYPCEVVEGYEADDKLSIEAHKRYKKNKLYLILSADKDLRMVPGLHYELGNAPVYEVHWPGALNLYRNGSGGKVVWGTGLKWFYFQLLVGDSIDNITCLDISDAEAFDLLKPHIYWVTEDTDDSAWYQIVRDKYEEQNRTEQDLILNGQLLWMKTAEDEPLWQPPI